MYRRTRLALSAALVVAVGYLIVGIPSTNATWQDHRSGSVTINVSFPPIPVPELEPAQQEEPPGTSMQPQPIPEIAPETPKPTSTVTPVAPDPTASPAPVSTPAPTPTPPADESADTPTEEQENPDAPNTPS